jgi:hypothetical protein
MVDIDEEFLRAPLMAIARIHVFSGTTTTSAYVFIVRLVRQGRPLILRHPV